MNIAKGDFVTMDGIDKVLGQGLLDLIKHSKSGEHNTELNPYLENRAAVMGALTLLKERNIHPNEFPRNLGWTAYFQDDKEVALLAVQVDGGQIAEGDQAFLADPEIALEAIKRSPGPRSTDHVAIELYQNKRFFMEAVKYIGDCKDYEYAPDDVEQLYPFETTSPILKFAGANIQADAEAVVAAIEQDVDSALYMHASLKDNPHVKEAISVAKEELIEQLNDRGYNYPNDISLPKFFRDDRDVARAAVRRSGTMIARFNDEIRADFDIVQEAVRQDPRALDYSLLGAEEQADIRALTHHPVTGELDIADVTHKGKGLKGSGKHSKEAPVLAKLGIKEAVGGRNAATD